ncbi:MAG TPA: hypothetical protein VKP65_23275 [Rhodothermales bacterium]|nr:hypothetical protein [Rhodothermales bacterium]
MTDDSRPKTCRCGHTVDHVLVAPEAHYPLFNYLLGVFMGVSAGLPKSIRYTCHQCGEVIEESTDPDVIRAHL